MDTAISWWLQSDHNTGYTSDYNVVTVYGEKDEQPWQNAQGPKFIANELRACRFVGLYLRFPVYQPLIQPGCSNQQKHVITAWGDDGANGDPVNQNPEWVRVTDSDRSTPPLTPSVDPYEYIDSAVDDGWYLDYLPSNNPFLDNVVTLSVPDTVCDHTGRRVMGSYKVTQDDARDATGLHYTAGAYDSPRICTYSTSLSGDNNWSTSDRPQIVKHHTKGGDCIKPECEHIEVDWKFSPSEEVPQNTKITITTEFQLPKFNVVSHRDVKFTYDAPREAGLPKPSFGWRILTPDSDGSTGGGVVTGALELFADPTGQVKIGDYRFQHEYGDDQCNSHTFELKSFEPISSTLYVKNLRFGHSNVFLTESAIWTFNSWSQFGSDFDLAAGQTQTLLLAWDSFCPGVCGQDDGDPLVNNCCVNRAADPPAIENLGCENELCCQIVCSTPGNEICCNQDWQGWDSECVAQAVQTPACHCPCAITCPGGAQVEAEACGADTNGGCDNLPSPEAFETLGTLTLNTSELHCGTVHAAGGTRDTDWYTVTVPSTASGFATLNIVMNGSAPVGVFVFSRLEPADTGAGETFCTDKQCSAANACEAATACTDDNDCPGGETCDTVGSTLLLHDTLATGSCQPTDGITGCNPLITCVPAPGDYVLVFVTAQAEADCALGNGIFDGIACNGQDEYSMTITATNDCADGACCMYNGTCEDGSPGLARNEFECFLAGGSFAGEGETCEALPPDVDCVDLAHGCALAQTVTCGSTTAVNLQTDDHFPEEPYPCGAAGNDPNDRWWGKFVLTCVDDGPGPDCNDQAGPDTASVRVDTCTSVNPGRDSLLGVYGSCCPPSGLCPGTGSECTPGVSLCGGACSAGTPFAVAGCSDDDCGFTGLLSDICATDLIEGETYYIQVSNWGGAVNGTYVLSLECPCTGACCNASSAACTDVAAENCEPSSSFTPEMSCDELVPPCGVGACCHPNGTCEELRPTDCPHNYIPGTACNLVACGIAGCGECQKHGDIAPPPAGRCLVDVDDLLCALDSFTGSGVCGTGLLGDIVASGGGCSPDGLDDIDDLLAVLDAFEGTFGCPDPCPPGACIGDFIDDEPDNPTCRDGNDAGSFFVGNGMSETDCYVLTGGAGTYCGDGTVCTSATTCSEPR